MISRTSKGYFFSIILFLAISIITNAQEMILEYITGKEIILYTPDFKIILIEELKEGFQIPEGSIIETGKKSYCELRLFTDKTLIRLAENTTFKVQKIQKSDDDIHSEYKLLNGKIRVLVPDESSLNSHLFNFGTATGLIDSADFGLAFIKGKEEIIFVLEGECETRNATGQGVTVKANEMVNFFSTKINTEDIPGRILRLIDSDLKFKNKADILLDLDDERQVTSDFLISPTPDSTPEPTTPESTPEPTQKPTPEREYTPVPTTFDTPEFSLNPEESTPNPTPEVIQDLTIDESYKVLDDSKIAFTGSKLDLTEFTNIPYPLKDSSSYKEVIIINEVLDEFITVNNTIDEGDEAAGKNDEYKILEIYNIYGKSESISGQRVYKDYIDSVYLTGIKDDKIVFSYMWDGAAKNIKAGYLLYPTGRMYNIAASEKNITIHQKEQVKKEQVKKEQVKEEQLLHKEDILIEPKITEEADSKTFQVFNFGFGAGASLALIVDLSLYQNLNVLIPASRLSIYFETILRFLPWLGIGIDGGGVGMVSAKYNFLDISGKGFIRFGSGGTFIQPYCGYYFAILYDSLDFSGLDLGLKASLIGIYIEGSYIFGALNGGTNYFRVAVGYGFCDLLG